MTADMVRTARMNRFAKEYQIGGSLPRASAVFLRRNV